MDCLVTSLTLTMNGLVLIDKPGGCTSHDVVNRWRKWANTRRVGHLGTLDPMATGLLLLLTGTATRLAPYFATDEKTYEAEITLGLMSDTYDIEGQLRPTGASVPDHPETIALALRQFSGKFWQMPPPVSAKKIGGVPAYKLHRKNVEFELKPVEVEVKKLQIRRITQEKVRLTITCTAGTYIRSIAHDLGRSLGCGALLSGLRRVAVGAMRVEAAFTLDTLNDLARSGRLTEAIVPLGQLLPHLPAEHFDLQVEAQIRQGRDFRTSPFVVPPGAPTVKALSRAGELIAMGELRLPNIYHPSTVF
jgi:tRNA pseudouridine55 synthase